MLRHIEFLLSVHDCVIVNGLGAFIAVPFDAHYAKESMLFVGPGRKFTFNENLNITDGLLENSIARAENIDADKAFLMVQAEVDKIKEELVRNGEFTMGRIGRLEKTLMGVTQFVPFGNDLISSLSGWVESVEIAELDSTRKKTRKHREYPDIKPEKPEYHRFRRFIRTAAGAAAAILIAIVVSTPVAVKDTYTASTVPVVTTSTTLNAPATKTAIAKAEPVATTKKAEPEVKDNKEQVSTPSQQPSSSVSQTREDKPSTGDIRFNPEDAYVVVIGSLTTEEDARKFVSNLERKSDLQFGITPAGANFRVYVATGASAKDAMALAGSPRIKAEFPNAWAVRK